MHFTFESKVTLKTILTTTSMFQTEAGSSSGFAEDWPYDDKPRLSVAYPGGEVRGYNLTELPWMEIFFFI